MAYAKGKPLNYVGAPNKNTAMGSNPKYSVPQPNKISAPRVKTMDHASNVDHYRGLKK